jgi:hypothetical protein
MKVSAMNGPQIVAVAEEPESDDTIGSTWGSSFGQKALTFSASNRIGGRDGS